MTTTRKITIIWAAAPGADSGYQYRIMADKSAPGAYAQVALVASVAGPDSQHSPIMSTLAAQLEPDDTTIQLLAGTGVDFADVDYVSVGGQLIKLGSLASTDVYNIDAISMGGTLAETHAVGTVVYAAHMSYIDPNVDFGSSRHVIRYRVETVDGDDEDEGQEFVAVNPSVPDDNSLCTVWWIDERAVGGDAYAGLETKLTFTGSGWDRLVATGEHLPGYEETVATDSDGYVEFQVVRDRARKGAGAYAFSGGLAADVASVPDQAMAHVSEVI